MRLLWHFRRDPWMWVLLVWTLFWRLLIVVDRLHTAYLVWRWQRRI